jgi:REP element-mobilizing transposase RayT
VTGFYQIDGEMLMKSFSRKPPRWQDANSIYFLTFCTFHRQRLLDKNQIPEFLIEELRFYSKKLKDVIAFTIMPEHIHLLIEIETVQSMSVFLRDFKKFTSHEIKKHAIEEHVWQRGTMDHCMRISLENKDFENHLSYIFSNSWKHLGIKPKDFLYHNFYEIVQKGWLEEDFFDFVAPKEFDRYE